MASLAMLVNLSSLGAAYCHAQDCSLLANCALATRFRPYIKSSTNGTPSNATNDEKYRPASWEWLIKNSDMKNGNTLLLSATQLSDPTQLIVPVGSNLLKVNSSQGNPGIDLDVHEDALVGEPWSDVIHLNHGIYAHVEDIDENYVNIEYTILWAYNDAVDTHPGDVTSIEVVYDRRTDLLNRIAYSDHGCFLEVFDLSTGYTMSYQGLSGLNESEQPEQVEVARADISTVGTVNSGCVPTRADPHVFYYLDPGTHQYGHPTVYFEVGSHEPWPNETGWVSAGPTHQGGGVSFLSDGITYLGTFTSPTSGEEPIVYYNGKLGTDPQAFALHNTWYWPGPNGTNGRSLQSYAAANRFTDPDPYKQIDSLPWPPTSTTLPENMFVIPRSNSDSGKTFVGSNLQPFSGLRLAYSFAPARSTLWLGSGSYNEPILMDRAMTLRVQVGKAIIGSPN
jgi:hypothetical protein